MVKSSLDIREEVDELRNKAKSIIDVAISEVRKLTESEESEINNIKTQITDLRSTLGKLTNKTNTKENMKETKFSLINAIRSVANNKPLDSVTEAVINEGKNEMRKAGMNFEGQIQLPVETRAAITVTAEHDDIVATDVFNVLEPLRAKNVLVEAGAKYLTNLQGDVVVPNMSASNVTWEGETASAKDGAGAIASIKLQPKRLTAYVDVSKQFIMQDGAGAEALIRQDLVNAINSKLEATILGDTQITGAPAGLGVGANATAVTSFKELATLEATVEGANFTGEMKYIMAPDVKAALRNMPKSAKTTQLVMEHGEVDGTPALVTSNVPAKKMYFGDFSNVVIGQWGAIDLTVDPYTKAGDGQIRLVVNAYFDAKLARTGAVAVGTTATE